MDQQYLVTLLNDGSEAWNTWREAHAGVRLDLSQASLTGLILPQVNLHQVMLPGADLSRANLQEANLRGAELSGANLYKANLRAADLSEAKLDGADLRDANLSSATLQDTVLMDSQLSKANLRDAKLQNCSVHGVSAWRVDLTGAQQSDLIITPPEEKPPITVNDLEVAQLTYMLLSNYKIRAIIDTLTARIVLILGHSSGEPEKVLNTIKGEVRNLGYLPISVDFQRPARRSIAETFSTLVHLARFVIVDISEPIVLQNLQSVVGDLAVPIQPLLLSDSELEYRALMNLLTYPWVLSPVRYATPGELQGTLKEKIIDPVERKVEELETLRADVAEHETEL